MPIGEELVFRGLLWKGLEEHSHWGVAVVVCAVLWTLIHMQYGFFGLANVFTLGLALGLIRKVYGSLLPCVILHGAYNACSLYLAFTVS
ncbi:MAG: CPBP family intramembrane glutamic endopeptidase [Planctomycetota bacterium]|nr:CPBP family intramembrane glutamic endopeptidase [Planctomycetota bacterium]